ncbi:DUF6457 domain-containing protein [Gordonia spumicola]|nr:DUF6457 domain-containing protein [Gordonia spumicola]
MSTYPPELDRWVAVVAPALGLGDDVDVPTELLLDVTRDVAHGVLRPAAPITTYLIGLAVAAGLPAAEAAARVDAAIAER